MLTHKILKKYPINNAPYLVQSIDSNYNESYYSQKCWITSLGDFNNESDNLQNLCFSKLCTYTDSEELLSNNYPTEICKNLERRQCFFSSDSYHNFIVWKKKNKIFVPEIIDEKCWIFSFVNYKNFIILGLKNGIIQLRDAYNPKLIILTLQTDSKFNIYCLLMYKNFLISSSDNILIWDIDTIISQYSNNIMDRKLKPNKKLQMDGKHVHVLLIVNETLISVGSNFVVELWDLNRYKKKKNFNFRELIFPKPVFREYITSGIIHYDNIILVGNKKIVLLDKYSLELLQVILFEFNVWEICSYSNILLLSTSLPDIVVVKFDFISNKYVYDCEDNISLINTFYNCNQCSAQLLVLNNNLHVSIGDKIYVIDINALKLMFKI